MFCAEVTGAVTVVGTEVTGVIVVASVVDRTGLTSLKHDPSTIGVS